MYAANQEVHLPILTEYGVRLCIKREDLLYPGIPGNKYRKLYYNLQAAKEQGHNTLLTFGGAYSNHIAAMAYAGREMGFGTIGVIRGEELESRWRTNPTLVRASDDGMRFRFVSRQEYRTKASPEFLEDLRNAFGAFYLVPEGGANALGIKGCEEIVGPSDAAFDLLCCPVGTGGTLAGISNSAFGHQRVLGFAALEVSHLKKDILKFATKGNWEITEAYHFGGYAKVDRNLLSGINDFVSKTGIPLDPIYTGKMVYGILDLVSKWTFPRGTAIVAVHTGGLQGIEGMNRILERKKLPLIETQVYE